ncbi:L,D-transpeptidase family protein [Lysobacter sp. N42]|uniref:L,D-transpeptidase family protein n=1 Tax=Lysobacter sp. N42 TaxID=2545719 RepID=UPI001051B37E|nr:L,D-transpeptidase family protein [Lysobacter sp. N42]TCZ78386.1 hypothetical protein EYQ95_25695 [Lysobacter sp. N42]
MKTTPTFRTKSPRLRLRLLMLALLAATAAPALARDVPAPAAVEQAAQAELAPGEFEWSGEAQPGSRIVVVVSLPQQMAHVYADGVRIGRSTVSTGKPGHETPTGAFPILQKRREHYSNLYDNAPMPFMQRLTWDGIALHAGKIPGYPASHGCVRLPHAFAEKLFELTERDMMVVIADEASHSLAVVNPGERVPVNPVTGLESGEGDAVLASHATGAGRTAAR